MAQGISFILGSLLPMRSSQHDNSIFAGSWQSGLCLPDGLFWQRGFTWSRSSALSLALAGAFCCSFSTAVAQDSHVLRATFGRGMHAFFSGQLIQAEQHFSHVIASGSMDPRAYYFRAMTLLRLGRQFEAENDMRVGASFEARNPSGRYAISKSLQRIQGNGRRTLEKFRRQARLERAGLIRDQTSHRYETIERRGDTVLHIDRPFKIETLVAPNGKPATSGTPSGKTLIPVAKGDANGLDDDLFGDSSSAQKDDGPLGEDRDTMTKEDPFGFEESNESNQGGEATEKEPEEAAEQELDGDLFGGPVTTYPDATGPDATGPVQDDQFGRDGSSPGVSHANSLTMTTSAEGLVTKGVFFEIGRWIGQAGTRGSGQKETSSWPAAHEQSDGVTQAEFDLGPSENTKSTLAAAIETGEEASVLEDNSPEEAQEAEVRNSKAPENEESLEDDPFADFE
jgi:hypothetical protein